MSKLRFLSSYSEEENGLTRRLFIFNSGKELDRWLEHNDVNYSVPTYEHVKESFTKAMETLGTKDSFSGFDIIILHGISKEELPKWVTLLLNRDYFKSHSYSDIEGETVYICAESFYGPSI